MKTQDWMDFLARARSTGLLLEAADAPAQAAARPWPVMVLTFFGALLAAVPLLFFFGELFGYRFFTGPGAYVLGPLLMAGAIALLRWHRLPLFVEHLALVALATGLCLLAIALFDDLPQRTAGILTALLCLATCWGVPAVWVRSLLGLSAFGLAQIGLLDDHDWRQAGIWWDLCLFALCWAVALLIQHGLIRQGRARDAAVLEPFLGGWVAGTLATLAFSSGETMLVGASLGSRHGNVLDPAQDLGILPALAVLMPWLAALFAARQWPTARRPAAWGLTLILGGLAWFMPALGPVLAIAILCALGRRWLLAATALVAAAWIIGAFYYALDWPLAGKAQVLTLAGALFAALAWFERPRETPARPPARSGAPRAVPAILAGLLSSLIVVNVGIWQKEDLIAHGRKVFIELAPVDPRSLLQGDYMALNYRLGSALLAALDAADAGRKPLARGRIDDRGVLQLEALDDATPLPADQLRVELIGRHGRWLVASDAWYFREGEGERWSAARYAEIRVTPDGRALLVGMADEKLRSIQP